MTIEMCTICKGNGMLEMKATDLGGRNPYDSTRWAIVGCHGCNSKGYIVEEDLKRVNNILNDYRPYNIK